MAAEVDRSTGRAMSCPVDVVVVGRSAMTAGGALTRIASFEAAWSHFLPDSEIARLNAASGTTVGVSEPTRRLVTALVEAWYLTDGAFDPTLLLPLVELGYAASRDDATLRTSLPTHGAKRGRPDRVLVDPIRSTVQLPTGTVLDPGGLGKGLAADLVVEELLASGASGALVSIGGDLRVAGEPPDGDAWTIAVEAVPGDTSDHVRLTDGGVATSSSRLRSWQRDDRTHHHLLDPDTLAPTDGDTVAATVVAGSARWAEVLTKPAFVRGARWAADLAERVDAGMCVVTEHGRRVTNAAWHRYAQPTEVGASR